MHSDEELLIVLRQQINFERGLIAAAIDCLATPYVPIVYVISGFLLDANEIFALLGCYARSSAVPDGLGHPFGHIVKGQAVQEEFLLCVTSQERRSRVTVCLYMLI